MSGRWPLHIPVLPHGFLVRRGCSCRREKRPAKRAGVIGTAAQGAVGSASPGVLKSSRDVAPGDVA